jgi:exopolysaccharide biosynthesis polyprenyl glycosylphosphotransferase
VVQIRLVDLMPINAHFPSGIALIFGWTVVLRQLGYYDPHRTTTSVRSAGLLSRSLFYVMMLVVLLKALSPDRYYAATYPRSLLAFFFAYGFVGLGLCRWLFMRLRRILPFEVAIQSVLVVGVDQGAALMEEKLNRFGQGAFRLAGFVSPREVEQAEIVVDQNRILGGLDDLAEVVSKHKVEALVLSTRNLSRFDALQLTTKCAQMGLRVMQVPFTWGIVSPRLHFAQLGELQLIDLSDLSYPPVGRVFKRAFDLVVGTIVLLTVSPLMLYLAWSVRRDGGPAIYSSQRIGRKGRGFPFLKFRSMVVGADQTRAQLMAQNETDGRLFKIKDDPRITSIGRTIRRLSLDELPQIWNVLRGDMNLVGPRPLPVEDLQGIEEDPEIAYWFELRHKVPPGITGLWQVSGRSELGFKEMVQLDIYYVQNWSPWLDLKILIMTIPAVLKGRGAS